MINDKIETIISVATKNGVPINKNFNVSYLSTTDLNCSPKRLLPIWSVIVFLELTRVSTVR